MGFCTICKKPIPGWYVRCKEHKNTTRRIYCEDCGAKYVKTENRIFWCEKCDSKLEEKGGNT